MLTRIISAVIGIGIWLGACFGGLLPFTVGLTVVVGLALYEFIAAYHHALANELVAGRPASESGDSPLNALVAWLGILLPFLAYWLITHAPRLADSYAHALMLLVGVYALLIARFARSGRALGRMRRAYGLLGIVYVGALFSSLVLVRGLPGRVAVAPFGPADWGAWLMLYVAVCVWMTDTFAYLIGRSFGKHKLAPTLSPGKTIEGSVAGFLGATIIGAAFGAWIRLPQPLLHGLAIGAIAGLVGQAGDLFKSALKREIGIKDFGRVMPGHGGALDRFDSMLFVTPIVYLYLRLFVGI